MKKPAVILGALVAGLLTLPLLAVMYVGQQIGGFPFVPFGLFINVRDATPGGVITKTIETMQDAIRILKLTPSDVWAKRAEESIGIIMMLVIVLIAGAPFADIAWTEPGKPGPVAGHPPANCGHSAALSPCARSGTDISRR